MSKSTPESDPGPPPERAWVPAAGPHTSSPSPTTIPSPIWYGPYIVDSPPTSESETGLPDPIENARLISLGGRKAGRAAALRVEAEDRGATILEPDASPLAGLIDSSAAPRFDWTGDHLAARPADLWCLPFTQVWIDEGLSVDIATAENGMGC